LKEVYMWKLDQNWLILELAYTSSVCNHFY